MFPRLPPTLQTFETSVMQNHKFFDQKVGNYVLKIVIGVEIHTEKIRVLNLF